MIVVESTGHGLLTSFIDFNLGSVIERMVSQRECGELFWK